MNKELDAVALSIRSLAIDAIEKANSGHPGLPLGAAELAAMLYAKILRHNPKNPQWADRDRFILSAGHGSMLLYAALHLAGYDLSLDDIRSFRQIGSRCAGHPEYGLTPGVEATTGPLGQGISTAVGMAIAEAMLAARFNTEEYRIVDHYTYALVGEGCLMEGVSSEASSLAGTLKLGKLIVYYDKNNITIDGSTDIAFTEDIAKRYEAYGWQVVHGSMYSYSDIEKLTAAAKKDPRPSLIILDSVIGKGAPAVEGTAAAHGAPLGQEKLAEAKRNLGLNPTEQFFVAPEAYRYFEERRKELAQAEADWNSRFAAWSAAYPEQRQEWNRSFVQGGIDTAVLDGIAENRTEYFCKSVPESCRRFGRLTGAECGGVTGNFIIYCCNAAWAVYSLRYQRVCNGGDYQRYSAARRFPRFLCDLCRLLRLPASGAPPCRADAYSFSFCIDPRFHLCR